MRKLVCALLLLLPLVAAAQTSKLLITGQVLDETGKPVAGAALWAFPDLLSPQGDHG